VLDVAAPIAQHGGGTPYELPALVVVARATDQAVASAAPADRAAKIATAAKVYGRLTALLGDSTEVLAANKNALAAASRLAQYDEELGDWPRAADRLSRLVLARPRDQRLMRRAGLACFNAGRYPQALEHWRSLLSGLENGSDDWLEAKYYQISCLQKTDVSAAEKVFKQFQLLYPEVKSTVWREKFAELAKNFQ
jgi:tetratricopeptide (TPR) repeat protein